jgi:hypothetical protein
MPKPSKHSREKGEFLGEGHKSLQAELAAPDNKEPLVLTLFYADETSSMNKKVKVLFLGSLILNVLLLGLILGDLSYRFGRDRFWHPRMSQRLEQLPEPLREHLYKAHEASP